MKKIILILIALIAISIAYAIPQVPVQVYGDIIPALPAEYPISFRIGDIEYEASTATSNYGYPPSLVLIPVDDPATPAKEGYVDGEVVLVYINNVEVDQQTYTASVNKIDITLTQSQIDQITGTPAPPPAEEAEEPVVRRGGGGRGCFSRWNCSDWGACTPEGIQTRICVDDGTCNKPDKTEERVCTYVAPGVEEEEIPAEEEFIPEEEERGAGWMILLFIIIAAGGFGFVFYEWEKSHKKLRTEMTAKKIEDPSLQRLRSYVQMTLQEGYTKEQIKQTLLREGWSPQVIKQVIR